MHVVAFYAEVATYAWLCAGISAEVRVSVCSDGWLVAGGAGECACMEFSSWFHLLTRL